MDRTVIKAPPGFDPTNKSQAALVVEAFERAKPDVGTGWKVSYFDPETGRITLQRQGAVTQLTHGSGSWRELSLQENTKTSDGDRVAQQLESAPENAGFYLTRFSPHVGVARLTRMPAAMNRVRVAVATTLGVKPWDVQIRSRTGGGYKVELPASYVSSKHDEKLQEVAEKVAGKLGWYFEGDPREGTGEFVPSEPPLFPAMAPYPMTELPEPVPGVIAPLPIGLKLADRGDEPNTTALLDFTDGPHLQLGGVTQSGKSVLLNCIIGGAVAAGAELVILDVPQKAVDFEKWRPYVRKGGWGAASFEENAIALQELYAEGKERAEVFARYGAKKLTDLPADLQKTMPPVLIVVDEYTGLLAKATIPKALPDDHPLRVEAETKNLAIDLIDSYVNKIAAEMRFVGFQLIISTQVASTNTGIGTALRTNLTNKLLMGPRATDNNRKLVFRDPASVPDVPEYIKADGKVGKGVGGAELEGQHPFVIKGFFATEEDFIAKLRARGIKPHPDNQLDSLTRPDPSVVLELFPGFTGGRTPKKPKEYGKGPRAYEDWELDEDGKPLSGFAKANAARHAVTKGSK